MMQHTSKPKMRKLIPTAFMGGSLLLTMAAASPTAFAAWSIDPMVEVSARANDNQRLNVDNEDDANIADITVQAQINQRTEVSRVNVLTGVRATRYSSIDLEDREVGFVRAGAQRRLSFGYVALNGSYQQEDLLRRNRPLFDAGDTGEFPEDTVDEDLEESDIDAAASRDQVERVRFNVAPSISVNVSERSSVNASVGYSEVDYDSAGEATGLQDRETKSVSLGFTHRLSETSRFTVTSNASRYTPDLNAEQDTYSLRVGWRQELSERLRLRAEVGGQRRKNRDTDESDNGFIYQIGGSYRIENGRITVNLQRSALADAFGSVRETDRLSLRYSKRISDVLSYSINARGFRGERGSSQNPNDRDFFEIGPRVNWLLNETWTLSASYEYQRVKNEDQDGSASSNEFSLSVRYNPPTRL